MHKDSFTIPIETASTQLTLDAEIEQFFSPTDAKALWYGNILCNRVHGEDFEALLGVHSKKIILNFTTDGVSKIDWKNIRFEEGKVIEEYVKETVGTEYRNINYYHTDEGLRACFLADWGPIESPIKVILKTDRGIYRNERLKDQVNRGYDTKNEAHKNAAIKNPELHHIVPMFDHIEGKNNKPDIYIEKFYSDYTPIRNELEKNGKLFPEEVVDYFSQLLDVKKAYIDAGLFYADDKGLNHLIKRNTRKVNGKVQRWLDLLVMDSANASRIKDKEEKFSPTVGGHSTVDPLMITEFTGEMAKYELGSELYSLGKMFLYAATGSLWWDFDQDKKTAHTLPDPKETGRFARISENINKIEKKLRGLSSSSLITEDGKIDYKKYSRLMNYALDSLPSDLNKYKSMLRKLLTLDKEKRYQSLDQLMSDFERIENKLTLKDIAKRYAVPLTIVGMAGAFGIGYVSQVLQQKDGEIEFANKYPISAEWNGVGPELTNNAFNMDMNLYVEGTNLEISYPAQKYLKVNPGDTLFGTISIKEVTKLKDYTSLPSFPGKVYIEGYAGRDISCFPRSTNEMHSDEGMGSFGGWVDKFPIPKDLKNGVYNLIVEFYKPGDDGTLNFDAIRFNDQGIVYRKAIPIVVGDLSVPLKLHSLNAGYSRATVQFVDARDHYKSIEDSIDAEIFIPELNYKDTIASWRGNSNMVSFPLDELDVLKNAKNEYVTVRIRPFVSRTKEELGQAFIPMTAQFLSDSIYFGSELAKPGKEYSIALEKFNAASKNK